MKKTVFWVFSIGAWVGSAYAGGSQEEKVSVPAARSGLAKISLHAGPDETLPAEGAFEGNQKPSEKRNSPVCTPVKEEGEGAVEREPSGGTPKKVTFKEDGDGSLSGRKRERMDTDNEQANSRGVKKDPDEALRELKRRRRQRRLKGRLTQKPLTLEQMREKKQKKMRRECRSLLSEQTQREDEFILQRDYLKIVDRERMQWLKDAEERVANLQLKINAYPERVPGDWPDVPRESIDCMRTEVLNVYKTVFRVGVQWENLLHDYLRYTTPGAPEYLEKVSDEIEMFCDAAHFLGENRKEERERLRALIRTVRDAYNHYAREHHYAFRAIDYLDEGRALKGVR